jgi:hypothetical protein
MTLSCPDCRADFDAPGGPGDARTCPDCGLVFKVPAAAQAAPQRRGVLPLPGAPASAASAASSQRPPRSSRAPAAPPPLSAAAAPPPLGRFDFQGSGVSQDRNGRGASCRGVFVVLAIAVLAVPVLILLIRGDKAVEGESSAAVETSDGFQPRDVDVTRQWARQLTMNLESEERRLFESTTGNSLAQQHADAEWVRIVSAVNARLAALEGSVVTWSLPVDHVETDAVILRAAFERGSSIPANVEDAHTCDFVVTTAGSRRGDWLALGVGREITLEEATRLRVSDQVSFKGKIADCRMDVVKSYSNRVAFCRLVVVLELEPLPRP